MSEQLTISGGEIINDINNLLGYLSIGVGEGLDISNNVISIKEDAYSNLTSQASVNDIYVNNILSTNFINKTNRKDSFVNYQEISGIDISLGENMVVYNDTLLTNYEYLEGDYFYNTINLYSFDGNEWTFDSSNNIKDYVGSSTTSSLKASYSIDSNFIAIGNNVYAIQSGKIGNVTIYTGNRFSDPSQDINGSIVGDQFGKYVSLSNNKIAIGSNSKIFIYDYSGTSWTETDISYNVSGYDSLSLNHNILSYISNRIIYIHDISSNIDITLDVNASSLVSNKDGTIMAYSDDSKVYVIRSPNWNNVLTETLDASNAKIALSDDGQILSFSSNGILNIYQHIGTTWTSFMNELTEYENSRSIKISNDSKKIFLGYSDNIRVYNIYPLTNNLIDEVDELKIKVSDLSLNVSDTINSFNDLSLNLSNTSKNIDHIILEATGRDHGFCVSISGGEIDISDGSIIPFDKTTGGSGLSHNELDLFCEGGTFDTTTHEYEVAQSGKYMIGWNCYINSSSALTSANNEIVYDFRSGGDFDNSENFITNLNSMGFLTQDISSNVSFDSSGAFITFDNSNSYILKQMPSYDGEIQFSHPHGHNNIIFKQYRDGSNNIDDIIIDGNIYYKVSETSAPSDVSFNFNALDYIRIGVDSSDTSANIYMKTIEITDTFYPNIRIEKNDKVLLSGGRNDGQNETRHIINHLDEGDKLKLSVSGQFNIQGYNSSFYGYLVYKDLSNPDSVERSNLVVNTLTSKGDVDISGTLTSQSLNVSQDIICNGDLTIDGELNMTGKINMPFYGFQVSSSLNVVSTDGIFLFELIDDSSNFCLPTNIDFSNNQYTIPIDGIYKFTYELYNTSILSNDIIIETNVSIMKNDVSILDSGKFIITSNRGSCISQCSVGDTISIKNTSTSTTISVNMSLSTFSGYLIQAT